jgi:hypothetical protein
LLGGSSIDKEGSRRRRRRKMRRAKAQISIPKPWPVVNGEEEES